MRGRCDALAHSDPDYDYVSARISINAMNTLFLEMKLLIL